MNVQHNIAILVANGFNEKELTIIQKNLRGNDISLKIISSENGIVNGWADQSWGCFFPVDIAINTALASDYSSLIVLGGDKSIERLKKTAHTDRFVSSFIRADKPVLLIDDASQLIETQGNTNVIPVETSRQSLSESVALFIEDLQSSHSEMGIAA